MIFIISSFFFRLLVSVYNYFYGPLPGAEFDALSYHYEAIFYSNYLDEKALGVDIQYKYRIGWFYSNFLGYVYNIFENHQLLIGSLLSCIFWLFSAIIVYTILKLFEIDKYQINLGLFIYCWLFPTSIIYNSITLREPYILFLLNLIILNFIIIFYKKFKFFYFVSLLFTIILFCLLHRANIIFTSIILITFLFSLFVKNIFGVDKIFKIIFLSVLTLILGAEILNFSLNETIFNIIKTYRIGHFEEIDLSRAYYTSAEEINGLKYNFITYIKFFLSNIFNYLFQPLPWKITSSKDFLLIFENSLRLFLIVIISIKCLSLSESNSKTYFIYIYLLLCFFIMEIIYSQATVNWGTASRHHSVSNGLLLFLALFNNKTNGNYVSK